MVLYGLCWQNKKEVVVCDSVVWKSVEGDILEIEEFFWDECWEKIYFNKFVVIIWLDEVIYGYGFEVDQDFFYFCINVIEGCIKVDNFDKQDNL